MNRSNNINRINSVLFGALKYIIFIFLLVILFNIITVINLNAQSSREQELAELSRLEAEAKEHELVIKEKQKEQVTIVRDITIIDTKIKKTNTEIVIADKNIKGLDYSITDKNKKIKSVAEKIDDNRDNIYSILRQLSYVSNDSINLSFLSNGTISDVIDNIYSNQSLQKRLYITLQEYQDNKKILEEVKEALLTDKEKEQQYKNKQAELKREAELNKSSKNQILKVTKGEEIKYKQLLADSQKKIAQLRARLFPLNNANQKINFGEALDYAKQAQRVTGVRPAFVLAILTQESGLGANVGTCYLSDKESGVGYNIKTQKSFTNVMSPKRDIKEFINITSNLGLDPLKTPVSCPIASAGG
ncbi:MAG: hypothetical protein QM532_04235 [Cyanobium sp. MAG06]|nr:hypothetical protein [Cyanobium sp. MAG06]